jgi:hypothetical protein
MTRFSVPVRAGCAVFVCLVALATPIGAAASPPDGSDVAKQEPPLCTDSNILKKVKRQYNELEELGGGLVLKEIADPKQISLRPSPPNQYATKTQYPVNSRSCQGTGMLTNGKTDPMYWQLDYVVHGNDHYINYSYCSLRHDLTDPKCASIRGGGK